MNTLATSLNRSSFTGCSDFFLATYGASHLNQLTPTLHDDAADLPIRTLAGGDTAVRLRDWRENVAASHWHGESGSRSSARHAGRRQTGRRIRSVSLLKSARLGHPRLQENHDQRLAVEQGRLLQCGVQERPRC